MSRRCGSACRTAWSPTSRWSAGCCSSSKTCGERDGSPRSAAARAFSRTEGPIRLVLQVTRLRTEQRLDDAAPAATGAGVCRDAGDAYSMAHTASGALHFGVNEAKLDAVASFRTSSQFSDAERAALDLAVAAASVPNAVTDEMFSELRRHWSEDAIVEIVAAIAATGFVNRWNATMGTPLEEEPMQVGERHLAKHGWSPGRHRTG